MRFGPPGWWMSNREIPSAHLHDYELHFSHDVSVESSCGPGPSCADIGYMYFGRHDEHFFSWLPSVPQGKVSAELNIGGKKRISKCRLSRHTGVCGVRN